MKRSRRTIILALALAATLLTAACGGAKDAAGVVGDIERLTGKLESYHAEGTMTLNTAQEPQEYGVVVSYRKPDYYRIALTNEANDITQIVLRNQEGVFVLTPHLDKSFRFKSDWPNNQGQAYLFETLAQSIVNDGERQFTTEENAYVFDVMANYQNASLVRQKIWLSKQDYRPQRVVVTDGDANEMVIVTFHTFEFDKTFDDNWFDMQRNMTGVSIRSVPVLLSPEDAGNASDSGASAESGNVTEGGNVPDSGTGAADGTAADTAAGGEAGEVGEDEDIGIIYPAYVPAGVEERSASEFRLGDRNAIMIRYVGEYNYTLVQSKASEARMASAGFGTVVELDLGETVGVLLGESEVRTLLWTSDGVDYRLSSNNLPYDEMIRIAKSVFDQIGK